MIFLNKSFDDFWEVSSSIAVFTELPSPSEKKLRKLSQLKKKNAQARDIQNPEEFKNCVIGSKITAVLPEWANRQYHIDIIFRVGKPLFFALELVWGGSHIWEDSP